MCVCVCDLLVLTINNITTSPGHKFQVYFVFGELIIEPKELCTATVRDLCLFIRNTGLSKLG
jgi:hypothetical protein